MATITEPPVAVLSGPISRRRDCERALEGKGLKVLPGDPLPADLDRGREPHRGLPAHRNPEAALLAGVPNAGHTPGSENPESGEPYEDDPRVGWVDVQIPEDGLDTIVEVAATAKFELRAHYPEHVITVPDLTVEQRLEIIEAHQAAIHAQLRNVAR